MADADALRAENESLRRRVAELEHEAALYRAFFELLPVPAAVHREDGTVFDINLCNRQMLALPSREAVVGTSYNALEDPEAIAKGHAAYLRKSLGEAFGELLTMPPTSYDNLAAGLDSSEQRTIWTETTFRSVEVGGVRYAISANVDVSERVRARRALEQSQVFLQDIIENAPNLIYAKDLQGRYVLLNKQAEREFKSNASEILGRTDFELFPPDQATFYDERDRAALAAAEPIHHENSVEIHGELRHFFTTKFSLRNDAGQVHGVCSITVDLTAHRKAEAEAQRLQDEIIRVQEATLRALSTPLLPIAEGVVVMPLIGNIDSSRAQQVLETLLAGIVAHQASQVILDVTGVPVVDAQVADALVGVAKAVRLLGAQAILTGIQPAIARTLVDLDADLGPVETRATLESGIAQALGKTGKRTRSD
jgi:PAS domain S-box-containing protein